eukprot:XP_028356197.1 ribonucleoside-diphosphate reductase large subunit-like isoform X2 [Physeter catodon]
MDKDACNKKSNQKNLGTIKCGNLCTEVVEFTSRDEVAVCNLASVSLPSVEARVLNKNIFECIYYAALEASCELAATAGPYETYKGSPASEGVLQFDMWDVKPDSGLCDWDGLKKKINVHGLRNSLLVSPMPTASTSQILGNNEAFEPFISNIYHRRVLSGEFPVVNPHLVSDLVDRSLWTEETRQQLIAHNGSVQHLDAVPDDLKALYKTAWEIKQRVLLDLAVDRSPFIDQSQSLNIHMVNPTYAKLTSMHFYGWKHGLKTGLYYLRTRPAADAVKVTVESAIASRAQAKQNAATRTAAGHNSCQGVRERARLPGRSPSDLAAGMPSDCAEEPSVGEGSTVGDEDCRSGTGWSQQTAGSVGADFTLDGSFSSRVPVLSPKECASKRIPPDGINRSTEAPSSDTSCFMCSG